MDPGTGKLYDSLEAARAAGVPHPVELRGRTEDVQAISRDVAAAHAVRSFDETHECPRNGCTRRVRPNLLACGQHWALVSPKTQRQVYLAYRGRATNPGQHLDAMATAIAEMNE